MKRLKIGDLLLIIVIIALSVFIALLNNEQGTRAIVEVDGKIVKELDLSTDCEFVYNGEYQNIITVKNGQVSVTHSTCPDKSCVLSGNISSNSRIICCLPNKLTVRVIVLNKKVDVISG